jgi:hypothetical protein
MKATSQPTKKQQEALNQAKALALKLDKAIQKKDIPDETIEKAQIIQNRLYEILDNDKNSFNGKTYILYEVQALISWIEKDEDEASKLLKIAIDTKGDDDLYTESANDLIKLFGTTDEENVENKNNITEQNEKLIGVRGWLAFASVGIILSAIVALLNVYILLSNVPGYSSVPGFEWVTPFEVVVYLTIIVLTVLYVIYLNKLSILAKNLALIILTIYFLINIADYLIVRSIYESAGEVATNSAGRGAGFAIIWMIYFIVSKRVKLTLTK